MSFTADIQVTRMKRASVFEAAELRIRTAEVVQDCGAWVTRCYTGPGECWTDAPRPCRFDAEERALQHTMLLLRES